mgnify:CR=1 FL=1
MRKRGLKFSVFVEIGLIIIATFAFAHIIRSSFGDDNLVSAFTEEDLVAGVNTCLEDNNGNVCQEFAASECEINCKEDCIPSRAENIESCRLGTCYDEVEGHCLERSPKELCEKLGNKWIGDSRGNVIECRKACCVLENGVYFGTEQECNRRGNLTGTGAIFRSDINAEWDCLALAGIKEEGACVFPKEDPNEENACEFTTKGNCENALGNFYPNTLCSHPDLNTECEKQVGTGCFEEEDEVYWVDSCGNKENIYDVNKLRSWNEGRVLSKNQSCTLSSEGDLFANQKDCGNCNYLLGSKCGQPTERDENAAIGDLVCKNLQCVEEDGTIRENGESWCIYQGRIGLDGETPTSTPGSSHYRAVCIDGEIETSLCGPGRTGVCTESRVETGFGNEISSATCRLNQAHVCINYNDGGKLTSSENEKKCNENPDCYSKNVIVSESIIFDVCLPKYPTGFDLVDDPDSAKTLCNLADITCVSVWVKAAEIGGSIGQERSAEWQCVENCLCEESIFVEDMHDYCMALGDCGASVNYIGDYSEDYKTSGTLGPLEEIYANFAQWRGGLPFTNMKEAVFSTLVGTPGWVSYEESTLILGTPDLTGGYKKDLKRYHETDESEFINGSEEFEYYANFVSPTDLSGRNDERLFEGVDVMDNLKGASAISQKVASIWAVSSLKGIPTSWFGGGLGGIASVAVGAIIGFAVASLLIDKLGLAPGLDKDMTYGLLSVATLGGGLIGFATYYTTTTAALLKSPAFIVGIILLIIAAVSFAVLKWADIGDVERNVISFDCDPWQPIKGGEKCELCGEDGLRCNKYACQSLGANCRFINEGTDQEACIDIAPNDKDVPVINFDNNVLTGGLVSSSEEGRTIISSNSGDGCIGSGAVFQFGINTNEPAECRWAYESKPFEEMELQFDSENLLLENHSTQLVVPSLEAFGLSSYDPDARADLDITMRCSDSSGNTNPVDYVVSMCVKRGIDITAPLIVGKDPEVEYARFGASEQEISIWTNEPAECRWDDVERDYEDMTYSMNCFNNLEFVEPKGWRCESTFPVLNNINTYSIKCKDQPTLEGVNESARNANVQGYNITIRKSPSKLNFDVVSPSEDEVLEYPTEIITMDLVLETSGGMNDLAECYYIVNEHEIAFFNSGGQVHEQEFQLYGGGRHIFDLKCEDKAGNIAEGNAIFDIAIDTRPPKVTKVYNRQGMLNVVTDEDASCYYRTMPTYGINECGYKVEDAEPMADEGEVHTTPFDISKTYYIKCMDEFNNTASGCSVSLVGLEVPNV